MLQLKFYLTGNFYFSIVFGYGYICKWSWNKKNNKKLTTTCMHHLKKGIKWIAILKEESILRPVYMNTKNPHIKSLTNGRRLRVESRRCRYFQSQISPWFCLKSWIHLHPEYTLKEESILRPVYMNTKSPHIKSLTNGRSLRVESRRCRYFQSQISPWFCLKSWIPNFK